LDDSSKAFLLTTVFLYSASAAIANIAAGLYALDISGKTIALTLAVAAYNAAFAFSSLVIVPWLESRRSGLFLPVALVTVSVSLVLMYLSRSLLEIVLLNAVYGGAAALVQPIVLAAASALEEGSEAVPEINIASSIGIIMGDTVAAVLAKALGVQGLLSLSALIALLSATTSLKLSWVVGGSKPPLAPSTPLVTGRARYSPPTHVPRSKGTDAGAARIPRRFLVGTLLLFTAISVFFSPMPAYLRDLGFSDSQIYV
jgi:hypothetical protein